MRDDAFRRQPHTRAQGRLGEDAAVAWLERRGYRTIARNVRHHAGELDAVARDGDTLCFIEIKARGNHHYGAAIESVTVKKQRRIARAAALYLARNPYDGPCRFDVLGLDLGDDGWNYTLVKDAFMAG